MSKMSVDEQLVLQRLHSALLKFLNGRSCTETEIQDVFEEFSTVFAAALNTEADLGKVEPVIRWVDAAIAVMTFYDENKQSLLERLRGEILFGEICYGLEKEKK